MSQIQLRPKKSKHFGRMSEFGLRGFAPLWIAGRMLAVADASAMPGRRRTRPIQSGENSRTPKFALTLVRFSGNVMPISVSCGLPSVEVSQLPSGFRCQSLRKNHCEAGTTAPAFAGAASSCAAAAKKGEQAERAEQSRRGLGDSGDGHIVKIGHLVIVCRIATAE